MALIPPAYHAIGLSAGERQLVPDGDKFWIAEGHFAKNGIAGDRLTDVIECGFFSACRHFELTKAVVILWIPVEGFCVLPQQAQSFVFLAESLHRGGIFFEVIRIVGYQVTHQCAIDRSFSPAMFPHEQIEFHGSDRYAPLRHHFRKIELVVCFAEHADRSVAFGCQNEWIAVILLALSVAGVTGRSC
ncbi:MAG: hypothetical protein ACI9R3_006580 [Verrucomicrobiales bacterium]|jgi:hypothetical protein